MAKIIPGASAQTVRRKQWLYLAAAAAAVVVVAVGAGLATQSRQPALSVADPTKPVARNIAVPGEAHKEEQSWRAIEGARLESVAKDLATLRAEADALRANARTARAGSAARTAAAALAAAAVEGRSRWRPRRSARHGAAPGHRHRLVR